MPANEGTALPWAAAPAQTSAGSRVSGFEAAGTLPRLIAYGIDGVLLAILSFSVYLVLLSLLRDRNTLPVVQAVVAVVLDAAYFIGLWITGTQATLGMRLFKLRVGNAVDGRKLEGRQALRRWVALGSWMAAFGGPAAWLLPIWWIVLLISTIASPTKQGLHDRFANSVVVVPVRGKRSGLTMTCLLIVVLCPAIAILALGAFALVGGQIMSTLSSVGRSI